MDNTKIVSQEASSMRLDRWLRHLYPSLKYGEWARLFRTGQVRLNGKRVSGAERLQTGQIIRLPPVQVLSACLKKSTSVSPVKKNILLSQKREKDFRSWVLYEDKYLLVLNKPAGLAVQGGSKQNFHLDGLLQSLSEKNGETYKLVHRLDKATSGVLLVAKSVCVAASLGQDFKKHLIEKTYVALTKGVPMPLEGSINLPIGVQKNKNGETMGIDATGKRAVTSYKVLSYLGKTASCVALFPKTGRTHQLRVHLASRECPILGDGQYGNASVFWKELPKYLYLHAYVVAFQHPISQKKMTFIAPFPAHFQEAFTILGIDQKEIVVAKSLS